jgi:hypothetical protein
VVAYWQFVRAWREVMQPTKRDDDDLEPAPLSTAQLEINFTRCMHLNKERTATVNDVVVRVSPPVTPNCLLNGET